MSPSEGSDSGLEDTVPQYVNGPTATQQDSQDGAQGLSRSATTVQSLPTDDEGSEPGRRTKVKLAQSSTSCSQDTDPSVDANMVSNMGERPAATSDQEGQHCRHSIETPLPGGKGANSADGAPTEAQGETEAGQSEKTNNFDEKPTDEELVEVIRGIPAKIEDMSLLKPDQARAMLEERFGCSLGHRHVFIRAEMIKAFQALEEDDSDCEAALPAKEDADSGEDSPGASTDGSEDEVSQDDGDNARGSPTSPTPSSSGSPSRGSVAGLCSPNHSTSEADEDERMPDTSVAINRAFDDEVEAESYDEGSVPRDGEVDKDKALPTAQSPSPRPPDRNSAPEDDVLEEDESEASSAPVTGPASLQRGARSATDSSESDPSSESGSEAEESLPAMPRPRARAASGRTSRAHASRKRAVRRAIGREANVIARSSTAVGGSSAESDTNPGSRAPTRSGKLARRRKETKGSKTIAKSSPKKNTSRRQETAYSSTSSTSSDSNASSSEDVGAASGAEAEQKAAGPNRKKPRRKRAVAAQGRLVPQGQPDDVREGLIGSDAGLDEAKGSSKVDGDPVSLEKAIVQEELDDADEEKTKERKRIAAERQRQLDTLRVMDAAQLKEATRAQQGALLAKIKERQARVHAAMVASAKEELKVLQAEARKAAGIAENDDAGEGASDTDQAAGGLAAGIGGQTSGGGPASAQNMDIEELVAKEEAVVSAAAAAAGASLSAEPSLEQAENRDVSLGRGPEGASDDEGADIERAQEEDDDSDFAVNATRAGRQVNLRSSDDDTSDDSGSDLEILPAETTSAVLRALMERQKPLAGAFAQRPAASSPTKSGAATPTAVQGAAARAVAALPKGVRFSSPRMADRSRAANRRKLAANARTVANDRWAAQLGYQDGQEHIRDLKYMELKRRQQAHRERERKAKESEALAARLQEYAAHADADEEEFGAGGADSATMSATAASAAKGSDAGGAGTGADERDQPLAAAGPLSVARAAAEESLARDDDGLLDASNTKDRQGDIPDGGGAATASLRVADQDTDRCSPRESYGTSRQADEIGATIAHDADSSSASVSTGVAGTTTDETGREDENIDIAQEAPASPAGPDAAAPDDASDAPDAAAAADAKIEAISLIAPTKRKIARTYGWKTRDVAKTMDNEDVTTAADAPQPETRANEACSRRAHTPADSQALWRERPDSQDLPGSNGLGDTLAADSCTFNLDLDEDDAHHAVDGSREADVDGSGEARAPQEKEKVSGGGVQMFQGIEGGEPLRGLPEEAAEEEGAALQGQRTLAAGQEAKQQTMSDARKSQTMSTVKSAVTIAVSASAIQAGAKTVASCAAASSVTLKGDAATELGVSAPALSSALGKGAGDAAVAAAAAAAESMASLATGSLAPRPTENKKRIAAFFDRSKGAGSVSGVKGADERSDGSRNGAVDAKAEQSQEGDKSQGLSPDKELQPEHVSRADGAEAAGAIASPGDTSAARQNGVEGEAIEDGQHADGNRGGQEESRQEGQEEEDERKGAEAEGPATAKDRSAKFRAMLEAEREANRRAKKLRKTGMVDEEAEEEEEEEAVRGLGDFGFGVPASGTGTSAVGASATNGDEEEIDEEIREEDLEGIVDTFSDDEGDKDAQDQFLNSEAAAGERQALKDMVRRVREGFGEERGGRGRGANARGNLRLDELTAADRSSRKEARRLGLLNSDEEWSDDERGAGDENKDELDEMDEVQLGELLAREQRARHMGLSQTAQEYLESSESEGEGDAGDADGSNGSGQADEDADRREEARIQKLWVKRAKRRRVLAEVEQAGAGDSQPPAELLMQEDEDSQTIMSLLQCTNSRLGFSGGGGAAGAADGGKASEASGKRRGRDHYDGELDAQEVENGFGMGMSSKPLKRAKSESADASDLARAPEGRVAARVSRAFTMPQFVTSTAGYGGSSRAKQVQRKGSFLARSGSLHARSGSLASGKTTVAASKFVFVSSVSGAEDSCAARSGFEEPTAREMPASRAGEGAGARDSKTASGWGTSRAPLTASGANASRKRKDSGAFAGIGGGKRDTTGEKGRLWKGLCSAGKQTSRR